MERSFVEVWSLFFDDIGLIEEINRSGWVWFAFQLSFFREWARFPYRPGDVQTDVLQYLAEQLGVMAPGVLGQFSGKRVCYEEHYQRHRGRNCSIPSFATSWLAYGKRCFERSSGRRQCRIDGSSDESICEIVKQSIYPITAHFWCLPSAPMGHFRLI